MINKDSDKCSQNELGTIDSNQVIDSSNIRSNFNDEKIDRYNKIFYEQ